MLAGSGGAVFGEGDPNETALFINGAFIAKYDNNGALLWVQQAGASNNGITGYAIEVDQDRNVYVSGSFFRTATFGHGQEHETTLSGSSGEIFIAKYDTNGQLIWAKSAGGEQDDNPGAAGLVVDENANLYVTGAFWGTATFGEGEANETTLSGENLDIFIAKYNTDGQLLWARQAGGAGFDNGKKVDVDAQGNVYVTGNYFNSATFGKESANETSLQGDNETSFIAKYSESGDLLWAMNPFSASSSDISGDIKIDANGELLFTGSFFGTIILGAGTSNETQISGSGLDEIIVAKYTAEGAFVWARTALSAGDDRGLSVGTDELGNVFVTGYFGGNIQFGKGERNETTIANAGSSDIFLAKYSPEGEFIWATAAGGSEWEQGTAIVVDQPGNSYLTGFYRSDAVFGKEEANETTLSIYGFNDIFIAKFEFSYNARPDFTLDGALEYDEDFEGTQLISVVPTAVPENETEQTPVYQLEPLSSDIIDFTFDENSGVLAIIAKQEVFGEQHFTITADDGQEENYLFSRDFTITVRSVNDQAVITGQKISLSTARETPLTISLADIEVEDVDNSFPADFSLRILDGNDYTVTDNVITPGNGFTGVLTVPVIVNDGELDSEAFNLAVEVTAVPKIYARFHNTGLEHKSLSSVATGDLNNDGYADVITTGLDENSNLSTSIYINNMDGSFTKLDLPELTPLYNATIALGDYNNDGYLDILLAGEGYDPLAALWKNNGDLTFTEVAAGLDNLGGTNAELRDIDKDGDLDILLSGMIRNEDGSYGSDLRIYRNDGNDVFRKADLSFSSYAVVGSLGDYDNDGDLDLIIGGGNGLELYPNNGNGTFGSPIDLGVVFPAGQVRWFDYNNDQKLDFIVSGRGASGDFTKVFENTGEEASPFREVSNTPFAGLARQKLDIRDYNGDGFPDVLLTGTQDFSSNTFLTKIYDNTNGTFSENEEAALPQLGSGDAQWFDIDNDGDLDLVLTGEKVQETTVNQTLVLRNNNNSNTFATNSKPTAPADLSWSWSENAVLFSWGEGNDPETPVSALSYNLGIGTSAETFDVLSPEADLSAGRRLINRTGNAESSQQKEIINLADGTYYFRVQTIDGALEGSSFSNAEKFVVGIPEAPTQLLASADDNGDIQLTWTDHSVNEFSFVIEQKSNLHDEYQEVGSTATNENSFSISSLEDAIYTFRVKAVNPNGTSAYIESENIAVGTPSTLSNFDASAEGNSVLLSWAPVVNATGYILERAAGSETENFEVIANLDREVNSYKDKNLPSGEFKYRVKAINPNGESDYANLTTVMVVLGLKDDGNKLFTVYPNPSHNKLVYITHDGNQLANAEIKVYGLQGIIVNPPLTYYHNVVNIDMSAFSAGLYFVNIHMNGKTYTKRMVIR